MYCKLCETPWATYFDPSTGLVVLRSPDTSFGEMCVLQRASRDSRAYTDREQATYYHIQPNTTLMHILTPTLRNRSPTMFRADILVEGVKFWVPANVVCRGVPCGDGLILMSVEVSRLVGAGGCWVGGWGTGGGADDCSVWVWEVPLVFCRLSSACKSGLGWGNVHVQHIPIVNWL